MTEPIAAGGTVNFLIENWLYIATALTSGGLLLWPSLMKSTQVGAISPSEAVRLMNREKAVVVDVCEPDEYAAGHVVGARSIPLANLPTSRDLPSNKNLPLILVCASGARAARAAANLRKLGYANAQVLAGGMKAWREASLPIEKAARG